MRALQTRLHTRLTPHSTPHTTAPRPHPLARSEASLAEALQRRMEAVVLGLPSGSHAQRVQAEYLKELEARAQTVFEDMSSSSSSA